MEFEPTNANTVAVAKMIGGKGMEGEKKVSLRRFLADQNIAISWRKNAFWGNL